MTNTPLPSMRIIYFSSQSPEVVNAVIEGLETTILDRTDNTFLIQTRESALLIVDYKRVEQRITAPEFTRRSLPFPQKKPPVGPSLPEMHSTEVLLASSVLIRLRHLLDETYGKGLYR